MRVWIITGVILLLCAPAARARSVLYTYTGTLDYPAPAPFNGSFILDDDAPRGGDSSLAIVTDLISDAVVHLPSLDISLPDPADSHAVISASSPGLLVALFVGTPDSSTQILLQFESATNPAIDTSVPDPLRLSDFDSNSASFNAPGKVFDGTLDTLVGTPVDAPAAAPIPATAPAAAILFVGVAVYRKRRPARA